MICIIQFLNLKFYICFQITLFIDVHLSFHIFEANSLPSRDQIILQIIRIRPSRVTKIILIIGLNLLQLLLFFMIHRHQLHFRLLIYSILTDRCSTACFSQFYNYFCFLVLACIAVQQFLAEQLFACPPHRRIFRL